MLESLIPELGTFDLILIGIRVLALVFIISWVRRRITNSTIATVVTLVLAYLLLFRWAGFWLPVILVIIVLPHGPIDVMFDLALSGGGGEEAKKKKAEKRKKT